MKLFWVREAEALGSAALAVARKIGSAVEEIREGAIEVAQR